MANENCGNCDFFCRMPNLCACPDSKNCGRLVGGSEWCNNWKPVVQVVQGKQTENGLYEAAIEVIAISKALSSIGVFVSLSNLNIVFGELKSNGIVFPTRCKDCKRYSQSGLCNLYLSVSHEMKPDDFCSYGERREGE